MVHSTWDDWFVTDEVEATTPEGVSVWYLGCNGFILRSETTTLYIDPYFGDGIPGHVLRMIPVPMDPADATRCDAVLVSHEHLDHMHPPSFEPMLELGADVYARKPCFESPDFEGDVPPGEYQTPVEAGESTEIGDFTVHFRAAHDPMAEGDIAFVVEHEAGTFLHVGDSHMGEPLREIGEEFDIDVGALAFGSHGQLYYPDAGHPQYTEWYMGENETIQAANALELDRLIPAHHDIWKGVTADPTALFGHANTQAYPRVIEPVQIGDRFDLESPGIVQFQNLQA